MPVRRISTFEPGAIDKELLRQKTPGMQSPTLHNIIDDEDLAVEEVETPTDMPIPRTLNAYGAKRRVQQSSR
eukprot:CAMPEP_0185587022 /NCGR_PEP_ID=MMETSP0434-20130131/47149_1 /TAXON_ID=626734 ORGANISM="Favella taraikaensis, Strain Fe Narragansett Bay" /NCGR_SAMPLE_ID=MMETSP0434 /ASSEMBLY_ACC=CAM_ASM_000379 /LENGTH=71 /DNA_ID=CAMNT_0028208583 /DNA_START=795 /DNA_END=1010 /DNA_ORIENTATION=-